MTITGEKLLKVFYYITVAIFALGIIMNIADGTFDVYQLWIILAFGAGTYLIAKTK